MTDHAHLRRLVLQIERDLLTRARLAELLACADAALVGHRRDLRDAKALL